MKNIAIIGAGLAGLTLANKLKEQCNVTVFEKSRGIGGRLATRYAEDYQFDHGTQYFTAKTKEFKDFIEGLKKEGIIDTWKANFVEIVGNRITKRTSWDEQHSHFIATPKMNQIGKFLSKKINVQKNCHIEKLIRFDNTWKIFDKAGVCVGEYDYAVLAIPPEQAIELIFDSVSFKGELLKYQMSACFSLMLGFHKPKGLPFDAALVKNQDLSWISINSSKPGRPKGYSIIAHSTNKWANHNINADIHWVRSHLIEELEKVTMSSFRDYEYMNLHRWKYANIKKQYGPPFLEDKENNIAAIGDWLIKGRVESAFTSATSLYKSSFRNAIYD